MDLEVVQQEVQTAVPVEAEALDGSHGRLSAAMESSAARLLAAAGARRRRDPGMRRCETTRGAASRTSTEKALFEKRELDASNTKRHRAGSSKTSRSSTRRSRRCRSATRIPRASRPGFRRPRATGRWHRARADPKRVAAPPRPRPISSRNDAARGGRRVAGRRTIRSRRRRGRSTFASMPRPWDGTSWGGRVAATRPRPRTIHVRRGDGTLGVLGGRVAATPPRPRPIHVRFDAAGTGPSWGKTEDSKSRRRRATLRSSREADSQAFGSQDCRPRGSSFHYTRTAAVFTPEMMLDATPAGSVRSLPTPLSTIRSAPTPASTIRSIPTPAGTIRSLPTPSGTPASTPAPTPTPRGRQRALSWAPSDPAAAARPPAPSPHVRLPARVFLRRIAATPRPRTFLW